MERSFLKRFKILLLVLSGITLVTACNPPTVDGPVVSCVISLDKGRFNCGMRSLDYKKDGAGEWTNVNLNIYGPIEETPYRELTCISTEDWLTKVKPKIKEGAQYWIDYSGKQR